MSKPEIERRTHALDIGGHAGTSRFRCVAVRRRCRRSKSPATGRLSLAPVCLPYSPEFKPVEADEGVLAMERLAQATGGSERADVAGIWKDIPRHARLVDLTPWLLCGAILFILLEVLERRTGMVSMRRWTWRRDRETSAEPVIPTLSPRRARITRSPWAKGKTPEPKTTSQVPEVPPSQAPEQDERGIQDALTRARRRARERTERGP